MTVAPGALVATDDKFDLFVTPNLGVADADNPPRVVTSGTIGVVVAVVHNDRFTDPSSRAWGAWVSRSEAFVVFGDGTVGWTYQTSLVSVT